MSVRPNAEKIPFRIKVGHSPIDGGSAQKYMPKTVETFCKEVWLMEEMAEIMMSNSNEDLHALKLDMGVTCTVVNSTPVLFELAPGVATDFRHEGGLGRNSVAYGHSVYLNGKKTEVILASEGEYSHVMDTYWSLASNDREALAEVAHAMGVDVKHIKKNVAVVFAV